MVTCSRGQNLHVLYIQMLVATLPSEVTSLFDLHDVSCKPEELYIKTRKCEPDVGADIVKTCERKGYDIAMTTSLSSDVLVGYFYWTEYEVEVDDCFRFERDIPGMYLFA